MSIKTIRIILITLLLFALWAIGFGVRRQMVVVQEREYSELAELPFTAESALQYRLIRQVVEQGWIPAVDRKVQYPEGVAVYATYTIGAEYVYAGLAQLLPHSMSLPQRLRIVSAGWFCLGIPLLALWVAWWRGSYAGGLVAGLFYAVAISSVIRSTGQEMMNENFALPLLIAHLAFAARADGRADPRRAGRWRLAAALALAAALMSWDLIQYYVLLQAAWWWGRSLFRRLDDAEAAQLKIQLPVLLAAGLINPYLRAHAFVFSPAMLLAYGAAAGWLWRRRPRASRDMLLFTLAMGGVALWIGQAYYSGSYGHFLELLWAKIRFLNVKPADPALLTFDQRILWTPALHSATWPTVVNLFPAILGLTLVAFVVTLFKFRAIPGGAEGRLWWCAGISLIAFVYFVRFHVFLSLFSIGLLGGLVAWAVTTRRRRRWLVWTLVLAGFFLEAAQTFYHPERWGRGETYVNETNELAAWLRTNAAPAGVLANFRAGGAILTYGDCPIVLHPKFEDAAIRRRVQEYGERLFKGGEREFRDWADQYRTVYYVWSIGEFARTAPELQMRYHVNALNPGSNVCARLFDSRPPRDGRYFQYLWGNRKYRVFRMLSRAEEIQAAEWARAAEQALRRGDMEGAERQAGQALGLDVRCVPALEVLRHVSALRSGGFTYQPPAS